MPTKIEWATEVWNPVTGCTKISPGCDHCYAERMAKRLAGRAGYPKEDPFQVIWRSDRLEQPLYWKQRRRVFVCSMGDLFHPDVPFRFIGDVWHTMWMAQHIFLVLTKRPERMLEFLSSRHSPLSLLGNVWLGVSAENQETADERIPILLECPAAVRFVSVEPMLGAVDISGCALDWVICGCESGPKRRPMNVEWARDLRKQCAAAGVPFSMKQMEVDGKVCHDMGQFPLDLRVREFPKGR